MELLIYLIKIIQKLGRKAEYFCVSIGQILKSSLVSLSEALTPPFYAEPFLKQLISVGFNSLPVVGVTALFTGAALALQIFSGGSRFNAETVVPSIVAIGMTRELGPVLCGLIVAGRLSSSIAAEIGSMKVTEQLDALKSLSVSPIRYLVTPRLASSVYAFQFLL